MVSGIVCGGLWLLEGNYLVVVLQQVVQGLVVEYFDCEGQVFFSQVMFVQVMG